MNAASYSLPPDVLSKIKSRQDELVSMLLEIKSGFKDLLKVNYLRHPELCTVYQQLLDFMVEVEIHFAKEAVAVLPFVRRYTEELNKKSWDRKPRIFSACTPIDLMYHEHRKEEEQFTILYEKILSISIDEDPHHFTMICQQLGIFEKLWQEQIHLEDDILFPGIIEMEAILDPFNT